MSSLSEDLAIGIDIGATKIRVGIGDRKGNIYRKKVVFTPKEGDCYTISNLLIEIIDELINGVSEKIRGIGIGSIGPLNLQEGAIIGTANINIKRIELVKPLEEKYRLPVVLFNDCVAAVWGEKHFGQGRNVNNLVYITLSTGIGGGVIVNGHLLLGKDGNAHEIGHIVIDYEGRLICGCGGPGHWEAYCSGSNLPKYARLLIEEGKVKCETSASKELFNRIIDGTADTKMIFQKAHQGDKLALQIVEHVGRLNAIGFANVVTVYDPELIIVGGAIAINNPELVLKPIRKHLGRYTLNREPRIVLTQLGDDVGIYGALAAIFYTPPEYWEIAKSPANTR